MSDMYLTADGAEITLGGVHWDNDLSLVRIEKVADWAATDREPAWHQTLVILRHDGTPGQGRTNHSDGSRLAARHPVTGQLAAEARAEAEAAMTAETLEDLGVTHSW